MLDQNKKVLNQYLLSLALANQTEKAIFKHRVILEKFLTECKMPVEELDPKDFLKWFQTFSIGRKESTTNVIPSILSAFFKFCLVEGYVTEIFVGNDWRPKRTHGFPKYLNKQKYAQVKIAAEQLPLRDRILVFLLLSSGCRSLELTRLTIQDIDVDKRTATIKEKSGSRYIHFSVECALLLKDYLRIRSGEPIDPLFVNKFNKVLEPNDISNVTKKVGRLAGLGKPLHPHCCRNTFVKNMLAKGESIEFIADEIGHRRLNVAQMYAHIPTEDII